MIGYYFQYCIKLFGSCHINIKRHNMAGIYVEKFEIYYNINS